MAKSSPAGCDPALRVNPPPQFDAQRQRLPRDFPAPTSGDLRAYADGWSSVRRRGAARHIASARRRRQGMGLDHPILQQQRDRESADAHRGAWRNVRRARSTSARFPRTASLPTHIARNGARRRCPPTGAFEQQLHTAGSNRISPRSPSAADPEVVNRHAGGSHFSLSARSRRTDAARRILSGPPRCARSFVRSSCRESFGWQRMVYEACFSARRRHVCTMTDRIRLCCSSTRPRCAAICAARLV